MTDFNGAIKALTEIGEKTANSAHQKRTTIAKLGKLNASTATYDFEVSTRPGFIYVTIERGAGVTEAIARDTISIARIANTAVKLEVARDGEYEIVGIDGVLYSASLPATGAPPPPVGGGDRSIAGGNPDPVEGRRLLPGLVTVTNPVSMSVIVDASRDVSYDYRGTEKNASGLTIDLTSNVPGASLCRMVLISIDPVTNTLVATNGATAAIGSFTSLGASSYASRCYGGR